MSNFLIDEDTDLLAAEFVLGTLDAQERANAQSLLRTDHGFIAMVRIWERRFGELHLMVEPVEPEAKIWQRIKTKIAEIGPSEPAPEGKPPTESTPGPEPAAGAAAADAPANPDLAEPADAAAGGETPAPANGAAAVGSAEIVPTGGAEKPAEIPAAPDLVVPAAAVSAAGAMPPAAEAQPGAESPSSELAARSEPGPDPKVAIPAAPPLPPPALKLPDKRFDKPETSRPARGPEITIDIVRSRGRWRAYGVCMTLLVVGLVALLAAWRFIPDRLPAGLRPAQLMMSLGIQAPNTAAAVRRAPPESPFDE